MSEEILEAKIIPIEEMDDQIWNSILGWLNSQSDLSEEVRDLIAKRADQLRLKIQVIFMEMQKRHVTDIALDVQFESELRRDIRNSFPFLNSKEKAEILKVITSTNEDRIKRLENQVQGFDLFANIEYAIQTLSQPIPSALSERVKKLTPLKRQQLLTVLDDFSQQLKKVAENTKETEVVGSIDPV
jgi:hypothetical protein